MSFTNGKTHSGLQSAFSGGLAACSASIVVQPFDLVKARLQVQNAGASHPRIHVLAEVSRVWAEGGLPAFYRGLSASVVRQSVYSTTRFGLFGAFKQAFSRDGCLTMSQQITLALTAGGAGALISSPVDLVMIRMHADGASSDRVRYGYKHVFDGLYQIARTDGPLGWWRGAAPNIARASTLTTCQFVSYAQTKSLLGTALSRPDDMYLQSAAAAAAGLVTATIATPVDVVRTRWMNASSLTHAGGIIGMTRQLVRRDGMRALWRGWLPFYAKTGPATLTMFVVYEQANAAIERFCGKELNQ